jgi:hypothetical protein
MHSTPDEQLVEACARAIDPYQWTLFDQGRLHRAVKKSDLSSWQRALDSIPLVGAYCARIAEEELENRRADLKRAPLDNFTRGQINTALRLVAEIKSRTGAPDAND